MNYTASKKDAKLLVTATNDSGSGSLIVNLSLRRNGKLKVVQRLVFCDNTSWYKFVNRDDYPPVQVVEKAIAKVLKKYRIAASEVYSIREVHKKPKVKDNKLRRKERSKAYQREYRRVYREYGGFVSPEQKEIIKQKLDNGIIEYIRQPKTEAA